MVQKTDKNLEIARKFKKTAGKLVKLDKIILFGSRVKGTFGRYSDFDMLIVSKDFDETPWYKRSGRFYTAWKEDYPLEVLCYTPEEFRKKQKTPGIISEAVRTGIEI